MKVWILLQDSRGYEGGIETRVHSVYASEDMATRARAQAKKAWRMGEHAWHVESFEMKEPVTLT